MGARTKVSTSSQSLPMRAHTKQLAPALIGSLLGRCNPPQSDGLARPAYVTPTGVEYEMLGGRSLAASFTGKVQARSIVSLSVTAVEREREHVQAVAFRASAAEARINACRSSRRGAVCVKPLFLSVSTLLASPSIRVPATPVLDAGVPIPRRCEYEMMRTMVVISTLALATRDLDDATLPV